MKTKIEVIYKLKLKPIILNTYVFYEEIMKKNFKANQKTAKKNKSEKVEVPFDEEETQVFDLDSTIGSEASKDELKDKREKKTEELLIEEDLSTLLMEEKKQNLYLRAEYDNYRKQAIKERAQLSKFGAEKISFDLLNVLDNLDSASELELTKENFESFKTGVDMTMKELRDVLTKHGIHSIDCEGKAFDPAIHEALSNEPTDKVPAGHISRVFKKAYKYHDKILRPAQVVVAIEPKKDTTENS